ncbi:MAG: heme:hemopexin-binding protein [Caulobacter sp.]|nr:heme:hemopexin-binding protein [Caulobacter sp.]
MKFWRIALALAAFPAVAAAADGQPLSNTTDPTAVVPQPPNASRPIQAPDHGPTGGPDDRAPRFTLTGVEFEGATTVSPDALRPTWQGFVGKPVSLSDLHNIARAAERVYASAGYPFVAIVLTPQAVEGGVVRFKVVEGHISSLTVLSNDATARRQTAAVFGGLVDRRPLAANDVEGAYVHARDIPGLAIDGALRRGGVPGGMDLVVRAQHQDWRVYANANNLYPETVGPWGVLLGVDHFGSSPYGDQTSLQLYSSVDGGQQIVGRISHRQILNASGTSVAGMILVAKAEPGGVVAPLDLATNVTAGRLSVSQPLIERLNFSLGGTFGFEASDQKTKVFNSIAITDDRLRIFSLSFSGDASARGGYHLDYSFEVRKGIEGLNSSKEGDAGLSRAGANPQATVARMTVAGQTPPFHTVRLYGRFDGQVTGDALTAPEQYAVGNLSIGRGYQPGAAFGDKAAALSAEVRFGPYPAGKFRVQPFVFYDTAELWTLTPGAHREHTISSVGGGIRLEAPGRMHLDLSYSAPQDPPMGLGEPTPHARVLLSLTVGLDDLFKHRGRASSGDAK